MFAMVNSCVHGVLGAVPQGVTGALLHSALRFFKNGGPAMYVNLVFSLALALALIAERTYALVFRYRLSAADFMEKIAQKVSKGDLAGAVAVCQTAPKSPLSRVIRAGLDRAGEGELEVSKAVEEAILEHTPAVSTRISWLWSLANIATLVGLVGTIVGLIATFRALGSIPADQKQDMLSRGISEAMNNTAFGLGIAVLCIVFHLFLMSYAKRMVETVELSALKLENLLSRAKLDSQKVSRAG